MVDIRDARIAALEAELAAAKEQNAALAAALERFHALAATLSLLPTERRTHAEKRLVWEAANHPDIPAILARVRAEARREGAEEELERFLYAWTIKGGTAISWEAIRDRIAALKGGA